MFFLLGLRLANFRNYMFRLLRVTADRFLKQTKFEVFQGENNLKQGWALKPCKSRFPFNDRQKEFLNEIFEEGERTGIKANPDTVAKTMRRARNVDNERVFQVSEFLTSQQMASYFSRKKIRKPQKSTLLRRLFVPHVSNTS